MLISIGPRTSGTGGSFGLGAGSGARGTMGTAGSAAGRGVGLQDAMSITQQVNAFILQTVMTFIPAVVKPGNPLLRMGSAPLICFGYLFRSRNRLHPRVAGRHAQKSLIN
jgi:hypothetical protein